MDPGSNGDPFETLLNLEEQYYHEGYEQGVADGSKAGRIEGRIFGLEKGFEKFVAMGKLHGKSTIWHSRLRKGKESGMVHDTHGDEDPDGAQISAEETTTPETSYAKSNIEDSVGNGDTQYLLPPLPDSERLERHIKTLHAFTEPATFSTQNDEDSVADFDDRLKRAEAKVRLIANMVGEVDSSNHDGDDALPRTLNAPPNPKRKVALKRDETRNNGNIEDFGNLGGKARSGD